MRRKLIFSVFFIFLMSACNSPGQNEQSIFETFFVTLKKSNTVDSFIDDYYPEKDKQIKNEYFKTLEIIKMECTDKFTPTVLPYKSSNSETIVVGNKESIYIIKLKKGDLYVKVEGGKVRYLIAIRKTNQIVGWI